MESESKFRQVWFTPVFSSLLGHRLEGIVLIGVGALQLGFHLLGLPGWVCPIKAVFGIPCPGCGLTAAIGELLHGHVLASLRTHAFAPVFLVAFLILLVAIFLPEKQRGRLIDMVAQLETRTGITTWMLSGLMLYWIIRLFGLV
jgi:hypothetical protein